MDSRLRPDGAVNNDWLKTFRDPNLDAIVAEAIANNLDLVQAAAQVEVAVKTSWSSPRN